MKLQKSTFRLVVLTLAAWTTAPIKRRNLKSHLTAAKLIAATILMGTSVCVNASIIDITATFDGRIRDVNGLFFGPLLLPNNTILEGFLNSGGFDTRIVMEFDVSGISGSIVSADILLPAASRVASGTMLDIFAYSGNGTMELADAFAGAAAGSFAPTTSGVNTVGLTAGTLQSLLDGGATYIGIVMLTPVPGQAVWRDVPNKSTVLRLDVASRVTIDIKPGSDQNSMNPKNKGVIPVAVLGSSDFDATQVDSSTVRFGPNAASPNHGGHIEDANGDGVLDKVFHFKTQDTGIECGDTEATLTGTTFEGQAIMGSDFLDTKGCPPSLSVMEFDGNSGELRTSYTENGITATNILGNFADFWSGGSTLPLPEALRIADQAGNHFRFDLNGAKFDMVSVDILNLSGFWVFTSNRGGIFQANEGKTPGGTVDFAALGRKWQGVSYVDLVSNTPPELETNIIIDNFTVFRKQRRQ